jgi:glycosyltransferase involved in cell wall biosynthesis
MGLPSDVGFEFLMSDPGLARFSGQPFQVRDEESGAELQTGGLRIPQYSRRILLDVGDALIFFRVHGIATGIQRVVTEVTRAALEGDARDLQLVAGASDGSGVYALDQRYWDAVLRGLHQSPGHAIQAAEQALAAAMAGDALSPRAGDVLVVLGATWISETYLESVIRFKQAGGAVIGLIYDLIPVRMPHMFPSALRREFGRFVLTASLMADRMLCISEFTRRDYENYCIELGVAPPPTAVTRLASNLGGAPLSGIGEPSKGPRRPYVLFVSTIEGRKGHALLLRAWSRLLREVAPSDVPDLIFVGRPGWHANELYSSLARTNYLNGKVHILSSVSDHELAELYTNAAFTVYPSTYEGWGLPVAESLSCGTPVIASDSTSIPEVGGSAVTYFRSGDEVGLFEVVKEWLTEPDALLNARQRVASAPRDSWADVAALVLRQAREVAELVVEAVPYSPVLPVALEVLFAGEAIIDAGSEYDTTYLEASWQQEANTSPLLRQPSSALSNALGELALRGTVFPREPDGRWSHLEKPFGLTFRTTEQGPLAGYLSMSSGSDESPVLLAIRGDCHPLTVWIGEATLIKVAVQPSLTGEVHIEFEVQRRTALEDERPLGVMMRSLLIFRRDDVQGQFAVVEAQIGVRGSLLLPPT